MRVNKGTKVDLVLLFWYRWGTLFHYFLLKIDWYRLCSVMRMKHQSRYHINCEFDYKGERFIEVLGYVLVQAL